MAGRFLLRGKDDTENPTAPRLYHLGITQGRNVFYLPNASGNRTGFIAILSEGARFSGDTGCKGALKVLFAGFEIPEFDSNGVRNWRFHKGTIPAPPVYKTCTFQASTEKVLSNAHGLENGDPVAFHKRKTAGVMAILPATIETHKKYFVINKTTNDFQIALTAGGDPVAFDIDSTGAVFCYKANVGLFDTEQGKPDLFPTLKHNFAGLCYIEILLPADLSNGEDEPTKLKVMMDGKTVYDFQDNGSGVLEITGQPISSKNPALISFDAFRYDGEIPADRFDAASWLDWRDRCAGQISWIGGNDVSATPASFPVLQNFIYNAQTGTLQATAANGAAFSSAFSVRTASAEAVYRGGAGDFAMIFTGAQNTTTQRHGIIIQPSGTMYFTNGVNVHIIGSASASDRIKIAYEDGVFKAYKNSVPLSLANINIAPQPQGDFYVYFGVAVSGQQMQDIRLLPSGTNSAPRFVDRFTGGIVLLQKTPVIDIFETEIRLSAASWQDVDGKIAILPRPNRVVVGTFNADPNSSLPCNAKRITIKRRPAKQAFNYYRYSFRDLDDPVLTRKYVFVDRPEHRAANGYNPSPLFEFGVMTQSQMERLGESQARLQTDLDIGWAVEGFLDTLQIAKGDFVHIIDPASGFTESSPALGMVLSELLLHNASVENRNYEVAIITPDWYSDTAHGRVTPIIHNNIGANYLPPPILESLTLTESARYLDNATVPVIEGQALFAPTPNQRGRVFTRFLGDGIQPTAINPISSEFTNPDLESLVNQSVLVAETTGAGQVPSGLSDDKEYILIDSNVTPNLYQLKDPITNITVPIYDAGTGTIKIFAYQAWRQTNIEFTPNAATREGVFALDAVQIGFHQVRVQTLSAGGASQSFNVGRKAGIVVLGDLSAPAAPSGLSCYYNGVNLFWNFQPSPSENVAGYQITDGAGRVIDAFRFLQTLGWSETAETQTTARRVYAVSRSGVRSVNFAALEFAIPSEVMSWVYPTGHIFDAEGVLIKAAGNAWGNCGAALSKAILTDEITARFSYASEGNAWKKAFGFSRNPQIDHYNDFTFGLLFDTDNKLYAIQKVSGSTVQTYIQDYAAGDEFGIWFDPSTEVGENGDAYVTITNPVNGRFSRIFEYESEEPHYFPLFAGVAIYSQGGRFANDLQLSGAIIPTIAEIPSVEAETGTIDYEPETGNITGDAGGALNTVEQIAVGESGEFSARYLGGSETKFGLIDAANPSPAFMPFHLRFDTVYEARLYEENSLKATFNSITTDDVWSLTRENEKVILRRNGHLEWVCTISEDLLDKDLKARVVVAEGGLTALRFRGVWADVQGRQTLQQGRVGQNFAWDIPKFDFNAPENGQVAVWMDGKLVNAVLLNPSEIGADVIGGTAGSILHVGADGTLSELPSNVFIDFVNRRVSAKSYDLFATGIQAVTGLSATPSSGGFFAAGTSYRWAVTAIDAAGGETSYSFAGSFTYYTTLTLNQKVTLSWTAVSGAVSYKIYRNASGDNATWRYLGTTAATNYIDDGNSSGSVAAPPPHSTTKGAIVGQNGIDIKDDSGASLLKSVGVSAGFSTSRALQLFGSYFTFLTGAIYGGSNSLLQVYQVFGIEGTDNTYYTDLYLKGYKTDYETWRFSARDGYISWTGNDTGLWLKLFPKVADDASAVAYDFDTRNDLSTAGAKLARWRNQHVEKAHIKHDGTGHFYALERRAGNAHISTLAKVGGVIFDYYNVVEVEDDKSTVDFYNPELPANLFTATGDKIEMEFHGSTGSAGNANEIYFEVFGSTYLTASFYAADAGWTMTVRLMRIDSDSLRLMAKVEVNGQTPFVNTVQIDTVDFSDTIECAVRGYSNTGGDLWASFGTIKFMPKA